MRFVVVLNDGAAIAAETSPPPWLGACPCCRMPLELEPFPVGEADALCAGCGAIVGRVVAPAALDANGNVVALRRGGRA